jgi:hypothetical protein
LAPVWSTTGTIGSQLSTASPYSFQLVANDDSTDPSTYTLNTGSLPTGLSLSSSGLISGTPSSAGTFNFTVNARDVNGRTTASSTLTITVQDPLPQPFIWYKNTSVGTNPVVNFGTGGTGYNSAGNPSTTTDSGRNVWNMATSYLEFPNINLTPNSNGYASWTIAAVLRNYNNAKYSLIGSPTGSSQIVGSTSASNNHLVAYDNDGYPFPGSTVMGSADITSSMSQIVFNYDGITYNGSGRLRIWAPNRTGGAIYDNYLSNSGGFNYGSAINATRVGWSRGTQDSGWYLAEYLLYNTVLTDAQITQIRNYLGTTHPVGVVNN